MKATQKQLDLLYGYEVRLAALKRRGEPQEKIQTVEKLIKQLKEIIK